MDVNRVDTLLQFVLAVAGEEDEPQYRELRPIHLVKYAYLADLAYAERNAGQTFTGAAWEFYHFGPWSVEVFHRIDHALPAIHATQRTFESRYQEEPVVWSVTDHHLLRALQRQLPIVVQISVRSSLRKFGAATYDLLHHVYNTKPMINAAPGEKLIFEEDQPTNHHSEISSSLNENISIRQKKLRRQKLFAFKEQLKASSKERQTSRRVVVPSPAPKYDDVFMSALSCLEERAIGDPPLGGETYSISISPAVWKSGSRRDPDVS